MYVDWAPEAAPELIGFFLPLFFLLFYNQTLLLTVQKIFFLLHTMLLVIQISIELKKKYWSIVDLQCC